MESIEEVECLLAGMIYKVRPSLTSLLCLPPDRTPFGLTLFARRAHDLVGLHEGLHIALAPARRAQQGRRVPCPIDTRRRRSRMKSWTFPLTCPSLDLQISQSLLSDLTARVNKANKE